MQEPLPMNNFGPFSGAGIYLIYYCGEFEAYAPLSIANAEAFVTPIYVGKAIPEGGRIGGFTDRSETSDALYSRLRKHARKIQSTGLNIDHFFFRYLALDDVFIPLGENVIIDKYRPLWNVAVSGFGNNPIGSGRMNQRPSRWDVLHPPQDEGVAERMLNHPNAPKLEDVLGGIRDYFAGRPMPVQEGGEVGSSDSNQG